MKSMQNILALGVVMPIVIVFAFANPAFAASEDGASWLGGGEFYYGGAEIAPETNYWGGAELAPETNYWGGAELSSENYWGGAELSSENYWGGAELASENYWGGAELASDYYGGVELAQEQELYKEYTDIYETETTQYYQEQYEQSQSYAQSQSYPFQQQSFAQSYVPPKYASYFPPPQTCSFCKPTPPPPSCSYCYPQPPAPQPPVPPKPQPTPQPNVYNYNTEICKNNSCNTNIVDNSINGSFNDNSVNVATLYPVTPQPIVQYTIPQYPIYPQYPTVQQAPYCVITITNTGTYFSQVTLSWSSIGATSASISTIGPVPTTGSRLVYGGNQIYTMTVWGPGGTATCQTQNYVAPVAPIAPSVSLSQIPYTGFDFGPMGNAMYWTALLALAAGLGYLVVYFRGGMLALAGNMIQGFRTAPEAVVVEEKVVAPSFANLPVLEKTSDAMAIARNENGIPRIVITRT